MKTDIRNAKIPVHVRWMISRDMAEVLQIEATSFSAADRWGEETFLRCLRDRNTVGLVAEHGDEVLGFAVYRLCGGHVRLAKLAVRADCRRRQVGAQMIAKIATRLSLQRPVMRLDVCETSLGAQLFFKRLGFRATKTLRGRYDGERDAYVMEYRMEECDAFAENSRRFGPA